MQEKLILIIENDSAVSKLLKDILESYEPRHDSQIVERMSEAEVVLRANPTGYKLIALDLGLEDARNLQGLKRLKELYPAIPVGIITATVSHELQLEAEDEGAIFYITKPFPPSHILHSLITRAMTMYWTQYGICRKAWEAEQHQKLTIQLQESPIESPRLKRWQFWAGVGTAVIGALTAAATFGKSVLSWIVEVWQRVVK